MFDGLTAVDATFEQDERSSCAVPVAPFADGSAQVVRVERIGRRRCDAGRRHGGGAEHAADIGERRVAVRAVAVLVVIGRDRDEVAMVAERLIDLAVILFLVEAAVTAILVVGLAARRQPRLGAELGEGAGVEQAEHAVHVVRAVRIDHGRADLVGRRERAVIDRTARCAGGRRIDVGRAEIDVDLLDQLGVELLVRIDRIIARIVERDAVEGQRDARAVEAANAQLAARRAIRIAIGEVDAGDLVDRVEDRLAGDMMRDELLRQHRLRLGGIGDLDAVDIGLGARTADDDVGLGVDRTGRLGGRECRQAEAGHCGTI